MLKLSTIYHGGAGAIDISYPLAILYINNGSGMLTANVLRPGNVPEQLLTNRLFLLQEGSGVALVSDLPGDCFVSGYLLEFKKVLMDCFLHHHVAQRNRGLFKLDVELPFIDLLANAIFFFRSLLAQITEEIAAGSSIDVLQQYLFLLFNHANRGAKDNIATYDYTQISFKIADLIELHYLHHRKTKVYADMLGMEDRKLNDLCKEIYGKRFFELLMERLLCEAERRFLILDEPLKLIAFELGFSHDSHLNTYYLRYKGITPAEFRKLHRKTK